MIKEEIETEFSHLSCECLYQSEKKRDDDTINEQKNVRADKSRKSYEDEDGVEEIESKGDLSGTEPSYFEGDTREPLKYLTIGQLLECSANRFANRVAISFYKGRKLTYEQVLHESDAIAASLVALGLRKGDHVAIWAFNSVEWYTSFLGIARVGMVAVNLNPLYEAPELKSLLIKADAKALIMDEELNGRSFYEILRIIAPEVDNYEPDSLIFADAIPLLRVVVIMSECNQYRGTYRWKDLLKIPAAEQLTLVSDFQKEISYNDPCNIQFTSGTTNEPKGVVSSHFAVVNNAHFTGKYLKLNEKKHRSCIPVPFFHTLGTVGALVTCVNFGVTLILPSVKFSPTKTLDCLIDEECTIVYGTPTMYIDILNIANRRTGSQEPTIFSKTLRLERFFSGGAICLPEIIIKLKKLFGNIKFSSGYGMTEILSPFMSLPDDSEEKILSTVGRVMDHHQVAYVSRKVKIVNQKGEIVPRGVPGELCCKGYSVMKGYYKDEQKTKLSMTEDGWFHTGDRFIFSDDGYAQIIGRIKDAIIRGGENIEPKEVERVIMRHSDVVDAQVYGVYNDRLGEVVGAAIIKKDESNLNHDGIRKFCKGLIAPYKIPEHVIFLKEFPKTVSGKIKKVELRRMTEETYYKEADTKTS